MLMPFNKESWIWYTCAVMMIGARLISRKILLRSWRGLQIDDWIMSLFVPFCYTLMIVLSNRWLKTQSNLEPPAFDFSLLSTEELSHRTYGSKLVIGVEQSQILVIWSCKVCLLIMYHRLTQTAQRNENIAIKLLSVYVACGFVVIEALYFAAWCQPFQEYYAVPTRNLQCNAMVHHRITKAVFNLSSDLIMLYIALQMFIRSLLPMKRKLVLCGIFSLGIFVIAASMLNSYYSFKDPYKATWIYWYVRESSTAVLVANLPFTWTILRKFFEIGDFNETNPPPWTYHTHTSRTAGGRKAAHLKHHRGFMDAHAGTHRLHAISSASKVTQSLTLVGSLWTMKRNSDFLTKPTKEHHEERSAQEQTVLHHEFAPLSTNTINDSLEEGVVEVAHPRQVIIQNPEQEMDIPGPVKDAEECTSEDAMDNPLIRPPLRAKLVPLRRRSCESSCGLSSGILQQAEAVEGRCASTTLSQISFAVDGEIQSGGTCSTGGISMGGRSARDRRARAKLG